MTTVDKRQAILQATLQLVSERGFHNTPVSLIAKEAGVSAGIIYHYFANKDGLIDELYREEKRALADALLDGWSDSLPLRDRFRLIWLNAARYYMNHPKETAFLEQYVNSPYMRPETEAVFLEYLAPIVNFFEYSIHEGVIKPLDLQIIASLSLEVAISLAKKQAAGVIALNQATLEAGADACWDAIRR